MDASYNDLSQIFSPLDSLEWISQKYCVCYLLIVFINDSSCNILVELTNICNKNPNFLTRCYCSRTVRQIQVFKNPLQKCTGLVAFFMYYYSLAIGVWLNFTAIKLYDFVPIEIFVFVPACAVFILFIVHLILPVAVQLEKLSMTLLNNLKADDLKFGLKKRGFRRQLKSLPVFTWSIQFLGCTAKTTSNYFLINYFSDELYHSVSTIISIPIPTLKIT